MMPRPQTPPWPSRDTGARALLRVALAAAVVMLTLVAAAPPLAIAQDAASAPPSVLTQTPPEFPPDALADGIEQAEVGLVLYIDETGALVRVEVDTPSEWPEFYGFEEAAVRTVEQFTFAPATRDGEPVAARVRYTVVFAPPLPEITQELVDRAYEIGVALESGVSLGFEPLYAAIDAALEARRPLPEPNLVGTVYERGTRVPLAGVLVMASRADTGESFEGYTDESGRFELRGLPPGQWTVTIEEAAFGEYQTEEEIGAGERVEVDYYVERLYYDAYGTDGAFVYETREGRLRKEVTRRTLDVAEITRIPGNQGDALKVVENLPGVARAPFSSGLIVVRGSGPEDTQVMLDGTPIPLLYHFGALTSVVPSEILSSIDFFPGNFSARYGRATGGILDVRTRTPRVDRWSGYVDIDVIDAGFFVEGPITDEVSVQASARRSYFDAFIPLVIPDDAGVDLTVAPRYWDYQGRINWRVAPRHELEAFIYGSDDVLEFLLDEPNPQNPFVRGNVEAGTAFHHGKLSWVYRGEKVTNRLTYDTGLTALSFGVSDELTFDLEVIEHNFREELEIVVDPRLTLTTGLDILLGTYDIGLRLPDFLREGEFVGGFETRRFIELSQDGTIYQPALFVEADVRPFEPLLVTVGGRLDYDKLSGYFSGDIRSGVRYDIDEHLTLKGGIGTYSQPPQPQETVERTGNPELRWERSVHYGLGAEYRLPVYEPLFFDITGFYKSFDDLVVRSDATIVRNGRAVPENLNNDGYGHAYGMELLVRHELANNFFGWIAYTLSRAERIDDASDKLSPFDFDQTHILTILGSYKLPEQWQIGLRWRYVTGVPYTPRVGSVYDADADSYRPLFGKENSKRIEAFHQLDLRVDKSWVFDLWILSVYLDIQNVYYHANPETVTWNYDNTESAYIRGLPILPSIGIKGQF